MLKPQHGLRDKGLQDMLRKVSVSALNNWMPAGFLSHLLLVTTHVIHMFQDLKSIRHTEIHINFPKP